MSSSATLKALGLNFSPNALQVPEGSLITADNVIIRRDEVIEKRRGQKIYGNSFGGSSDRAKQISSYKDRLLRHYSNKIQFDNGSGVFTDLSGNYLEAEPGLRIKSLERNGNYYFTTSNGIEKLSVKNASDLSANTSATAAGGIRALDATAELVIKPNDQASFFTQDSVVAYRHLFATKDPNGNLILGTPSPKLDIYNPLSQLIAFDINRLLVLIDNLPNSPSIGATLISDTDYAQDIQVVATATGSELENAINTLAFKLDADIIFSPGPLTTASASIDTPSSITLNYTTSVANYFSVGDRVNLTGFTGVGLTGLNNNDFDITSVSGNTITANIFGTTVLVPVTVTADAGGTTTSRNYIKAITTASPISNDPILPMPDPISDPTTDDDLLSVQFAMDQIAIRLQEELSGVIDPALIQEFLIDFQPTTTASVKYILTLPQEITSDYFVQLYRSNIQQALGVTVLNTLIADDEERLVYEAFPTSAEITARQMVILDVTPQGFEGANLYTNAFTGEGIAQANTPPPFAHDINTFKGYIFYANTKKKQELQLNLLGVTKLYYSGEITDIPVGGPTITLTADTTNLVNGDKIVITDSNSVPTIDGLRTVSNVTSTGFDITLNQSITVEGNLATWFKNKDLSFNIIQGSTVETYHFTLGIPEVTIVDCPAGSAFAAAGTADYFTFYSAENKITYYAWFDVDGATPPTDPSIVGATGLRVVIDAGFTNVQVSQALTDAINSLYRDFSASTSNHNTTILNSGPGYTNPTTVNTFPGTITEDSVGKGEKASTKEILLSTLLSPARAIDQTTKSLARIINKQTNGLVYIFYDFNPQSTFSGLVTIENRSLNDDPFYVIGSSDDIGLSFSPNIGPDFTTITSVAGTPTIINWAAHGLITGDQVVISNSNITAIDGVWTITYVSANSFSIPVTTVANATSGVAITADNAVTSSNIVSKNRIYFSKYQQPEAVPLPNFIDIGPADKAILRIVPLRDSLFVYKEDGLYRLSGETSPFNVALFDSSCIMIAPDSVGTVHNLIHCWTSQGITTTSEAGVSIISRPIDTEILKVASNNYPGFTTSTWGVGYESDNAYLVATVQQTTDTMATIIYRYSNLTSSWTTWSLGTTCGYVNSADQKLYFGPSDTNFITQERKSFTRTDYADREFTKTIEALNYSIEVINGYTVGILKQSQLSDYVVGDAIVQQQTLTIYEYNVLLQKIDSDPSPDLSKNYLSTLEIAVGDNMRTAIVALANKLDSDPLQFNNYFSSINNYSGTILTSSIASQTVITTSAAHNLSTGREVTISGHTGSSPSINGIYIVTVLSPTTFSIPIAVNISGTGGTFSTNTESFQDIRACYNILILKMNADSGIAFSNYSENVNDTFQETVVLNINSTTNALTLNQPLQYIEGAITVYKAIDSTTIYAPHTMGDPLGIKHLREATIMLADKKFTDFSLSFSTDLIPGFQEVVFTGDGTGVFGSGSFGYNYFGGVSHSAPLRTYIPRQHQRCRYMNVKFEHSVAREQVSVYGITLTGEISQSTRGYR